KLRTLIIVNKSFLADQWVERINTYITNDKGEPIKIGRIQKDRFDQNCDMTIGMVQSITGKDRDYEKELGPDIYKQFDMVIVDECHHYASRVFSQFLLKISGKYIIGLSATPERKDGLMKVDHWFMGPIMYYIERKEGNQVLVKMID